MDNHRETFFFICFFFFFSSVFYPVHCLFVLLCGFCRTLWSPCWGTGCLWSVVCVLSVLVGYRIRPNYRTVCLGFSKLLGKLALKCFCAYLGYTLKKRISKGLIWWCLCYFFWLSFEKHMLWVLIWILHRQVDAIQMSTHNICLHKEETKSILAVTWRLRNCLTVRL